MKKVITILLCLLTITAYSQTPTTGYLRYDTVKIMKQGGAAELYLINATKDSLGLLTNVGGGLTRFKRSRVINDSTLVVGLDTLIIKGGAGGGGGSGSTNANIGSGYRLAVPSTNNIKTLFPGYAINIDSSTNTNGITAKLDSATLALYFMRRKDSATAYVTPTRLKDTAAAIRAAIGSAGGTATLPDLSGYLPNYKLRRILNPSTIQAGRTAYFTVEVEPSSPNDAFAPNKPVNDTCIIPTYDGDARVSHPSVLYIDTGWNGYKYWMAFAPYPSDSRENPSIVASHDGLTWEVPAGLTNPLEFNQGGSSYNSDPELIFQADESKMFAIWRFTKADGSGWVDSFHVRSSTDGIAWGDRQTIFAYGFSQASPTIVYHQHLYHLWWVDVNEDPVTGSNAVFDLRYRTSPTLLGLKDASTITATVTDLPAGKHLWHIEIRWDDIEDQFVGIFNITDTAASGGQNNGGILRYATATSPTDWRVQSQDLPLREGTDLYRTTFARTPKSEENGAAFEVWYNRKWQFRHTLLFLAQRTKPAFAYDTVSRINDIYSLKYRLSSFYGLPVARVVRISDGSTRDVYPGEDNEGLILADSTELSTWAGGSDLRLLRLYNQVRSSYTGDYVAFDSLGNKRPIIKDSIWDGTTKWGWVYVKADSTIGLQYWASTVRGITTSFVNTDTTSSKLWSTKTGSSYVEVSSKSVRILSTGNITAPYIPQPAVWSGLFKGTSISQIRKNGVVQTTGTTAYGANGAGSTMGAFKSSTPPVTDYSNALTTELVVWADTPYSASVSNVEAIMMADYPYANQDSVIYDTYTDANSTLLTSHTPELGGSYTVTDANWNIQSNKLTRSAAGSGRPTATIDAGITDGFKEGTITRTGSGGAGLIFGYVDDNNMVYVRVFGTTMSIQRYVAGSATAVATATVPDPGTSPYTLQVERWKGRVRVYMNGTLYITNATENLYQNNTKVGFFCPTGESTTTFDDLKVKPF